MLHSGLWMLPTLTLVPPKPHGHMKNITPTVLARRLTVVIFTPPEALA